MDEITVAALTEALVDEYKARATYRRIIDKFGPIRPFINIVEAEDRHAKALLSLFDRFGLEPPEDDWADRVEAPETIAETCRIAVDAEIENGAMYDRLLGLVSEPAIRGVFLNLREASQNRHLPAFRRCLERESR